MILEALFLLGLVALLLFKLTEKPADMPPGTFGLPVVGNLPSPNLRIMKYLENLKKKYGKIFTTKWGSRVIVVLADYQVIRKALNHSSLQGRGDHYSYKLFTKFMNIGILTSTEKVWQDNRRLLIHRLRDLCMGKTNLENSIQDEAKMLVEYLEEHNLDRPAEVDLCINVSVVNVIWKMLANKRYKADDEEIHEYSRMISENLDILQWPVFLLDFMPWLIKILPNFVLNKYMKIEVFNRNRDILNAQFQATIDEHKASLDPENPRDMIDYYLMEMEATKDDPESTFRQDYEDLIALMGDMFVAGSETISSTLRWMILYMALRPQIQARAHKALDDVVAKDRLPSLHDREQLPYIDALLLDVMRLTSMLPLSIAHCSTAEVQLEGYTIPKGTMLLPCLEMCHRDPDVWQRPDDLYPEHFLDEDGKLDSKKDSFLPFSVGRRQCPGESLARMELFLFGSAILQRFTIEPPPGVTLSTDIDPKKRLLQTPKLYKIILKKRI